MPASIVVLQSIGQLGNRLTQFAHLIAFGREAGCRIVNPSFSLYSEFFRGTYDDLLCRYPAVHCGRPNKTSQRAAYYLLRALESAGLANMNSRWTNVNLHWTADDYELGRPVFRQLLLENDIVFLTGSYRQRYFGGLQKSAAAIREHFKLLPSLQEKLDAHMASARSATDVVVGLHVRQGDNFTDVVRRDAFTSGQYAEVARKLVSLFPGKTVALMMCTNVPQPMELYRGLKVVPGPGDFVSDMYALAECDYIIGPGQSSFTAWASFMGQKPFYPLIEPESEIRLDDFKMCHRVG